MTRRERLERKLAKRAQWAEARKAEADRRARAAVNMVSAIPMGQPILVGHHSERGHRALLARSDSQMRKACEASDLAAHHASKAGGLSAQLESSIFSDDSDAIQALQDRIAERTAKRDHMKAVNAAYRKASGADPAAKLSAMVAGGIIDRAEAMAIAKLFAVCPYEKQPYPGYSLSNIGATIRTDEKRIQQLKARAERAERAANSAGGVLIQGTDYVWLTFAEKPERAILQELKAAGFTWGGGSWGGKREDIPSSVLCMVEGDAD